MHSYDPWQAVAADPSVEVVTRHSLAPGFDGALVDRRIWLDRDLGQAARRSTLAHELVHLERGRPVGDARQRRREEQVVEEIAARRLVPLHALIDAVRWCGTESLEELAEHLWVDVAAVRSRLAALTDLERRIVERGVAP
ncbi:ImmA/IrrE family metallo-endopeptidase [Rhodococcoides corynebacterioides]|uniref:ImmA/IrrE family metallo-endopeptidase n=1 Tax=Rhodococcoides corynebacterioides TaxID=53972 RepID=A0ABS7P6C9_9NOCA|nr:ImmA/IrrE family metallo-endopeptidase [Rhodococcus corynebacterioides]MBY6367900.1 ImmA/IrrE family metallo-endopeptidase [Rhodococcus corynebacterioides]MBY6408381.1 ImmA/IrrE family metallo-endopeptidase [Rhodococcus corynebacterioides]